MSLSVLSFSFALLSSLVGWGHAGGADHEAGLSQQQSKPNIVFIITDDQDTLLDSLDYMPLLNKYITEEGTSYDRHYCTIALCCPSRVSLLTGRAAHNTNVTDVNPPYGGYPKFISGGWNKDWLPVWMSDEAGYDNYYVGKLMNYHNATNYNNPYPAGFTGSDFVLDPWTYQYWNQTFQRNTSPPKSYAGLYSTDIMRNKSLAFLDDAVASADQKPFWLTVAPIAPHVDGYADRDPVTGAVKVIANPPYPAKRHEGLFPDTYVPRTYEFNPDTPSGSAWIRKLQKMNQTVLDANDYYHQRRLQSLQAVDEMVEALVMRLEEHGILDNTYVVFTSDNGYHNGQHRMPPGKGCGYETDIHVPLMIRGPGVPKGRKTQVVTTHTDLAPTFLQMAGQPLKEYFDGKPIPLEEGKLQTAEKKTSTEHVNVEFWGIVINEGGIGQQIFPNNTYKSVRILGDGYNLYYSVWCSGEHELFEMNSDPGQMNNLVDGGDDTEFLKQFNRSCTDPWKELHPSGKVDSLRAALDAQYDDFYDGIPKVDFAYCLAGQVESVEGPMWKNVSQSIQFVSPEWSFFV